MNRNMTYEQLQQVLEGLGYAPEPIELDAVNGVASGNHTLFRHPDNDLYIMLPGVMANKIVEPIHLLRVQNVLKNAGFWDSLVRQTGTENPAEAAHVLQTLAGIKTHE